MRILILKMINHCHTSSHVEVHHGRSRRKKCKLRNLQMQKWWDTSIWDTHVRSAARASRKIQLEKNILFSTRRKSCDVPSANTPHLVPIIWKNTPESVWMEKSSHAKTAIWHLPTGCSCTDTKCRNIEWPGFICCVRGLKMFMLFGWQEFDSLAKPWVQLQNIYSWWNVNVHAIWLLRVWFHSKTMSTVTEYLFPMKCKCSCYLAIKGLLL